MSTLETARLLAMKKTRRDSLIKARDAAAETRETLGIIDAPENLIRVSNLRLMELNGAINKINDEIFALEQKLGITPDWTSGDKIPDVV